MVILRPTRKLRALLPTDAVSASGDTALGDWLQPANNPSLRSLFPEGDRLFHVTSGGCSCDLVIPGTGLPHGERARLRATHERRGWSPAKVGRALTDWELAHERRARHDAAPQVELLALLRALASSPRGLRVLIHFYAGAFDNEPVGSVERIRVPVDRLAEMSVLGEDRLVEVVAGAA